MHPVMTFFYGILTLYFQTYNHLSIQPKTNASYIYKITAQLLIFFSPDFALQNMVETTLPDGLETSGQRVYR